MNLERRLGVLACVAFPAYALVAELARAQTPPRSVAARRWLQQHSELARGLAQRSLSEALWYRGAAELAAQLDLESLAHELRRARVRDAGVPFGHDPQKRFVTVLGDDERPIRLGYGLALFDFGPQSVITPHAHRYMASAHLVLEGIVRVRTFDRIRDEGQAIVVRPTQDVLAEPGHSSAMTTVKDNVHWFAPRSPRAMTLDVIVDGLEPGRERYRIEPIDPLRARRLPDGGLRAPLVSFEQSMALIRAHD